MRGILPKKSVNELAITPHLDIKNNEMEPSSHYNLVNQIVETGELWALSYLVKGRKPQIL